MLDKIVLHHRLESGGIPEMGRCPNQEGVAKDRTTGMAPMFVVDR